MSAGYNRGEACVKCPYYRRAEGKVLECNGGLDPTGVSVNRFGSRRRRERFMERRCCVDYAKCPICQLNDMAENFKRPPTSEV